ncbi:class I SAM-dependent methyltransferase [Acidobacteria bacterium AB60]|nr:class I SAM-dependent methyltransferase [Acidobacteria bacterium AB60]
MNLPRTAPQRAPRLLPGLARKDGFLLHPWDEAHGVRTSGLVAGRHLRAGHAHDRHITAYYGVAPSVFRGLLARWRKLHHAPLHKTTFIDIGAGMGRAVLLASELGFRRALGVELHPTLIRSARRNAAIWRKAGRARCPIRFHAGDAVAFGFPPGPCVAFLFNPFGQVVMRRWLLAAVRAFANRPGELSILYVNNEQEDVFEKVRASLSRLSSRGNPDDPRPNLVRLFHGPIQRSSQDRLADHRILANQPDGEYASAPHEDCSIWEWLS